MWAKKHLELCAAFRRALYENFITISYYSGVFFGKMKIEMWAIVFPSRG